MDNIFIQSSTKGYLKTSVLNHLRVHRPIWEFDSPWTMFPQKKCPHPTQILCIFLRNSGTPLVLPQTCPILFYENISCVFFQNINLKLLYVEGVKVMINRRKEVNLTNLSNKSFIHSRNACGYLWCARKWNMTESTALSLPSKGSHWLQPECRQIMQRLHWREKHQLRQLRIKGCCWWRMNKLFQHFAWGYKKRQRNNKKI